MCRNAHEWAARETKRRWSIRRRSILDRTGSNTHWYGFPGSVNEFDTDQFCSAWYDPCTCHIRRSLDHPNSVCTAANQAQSNTDTHTYIPCTPEGVLTQTKPCKNHEKALCNSLYPHGTDAGGSSEIRCEGTLSTELLYVAARVHRTYDGTRCQIKAPDRGINHGVYDKQQLFDQIKNIRLPPSGLLYAGMHATQRGMPSLTFLSVTQPWPKEHRLKVDESLKPTRTAWQLI